MKISAILLCPLLSLIATHPVTAQTPLRVYISADMEGIAGLSATDDGLGRKLMTEEVNAAIAGAFDGGAIEVVVNDAHGSHTNLLQDLLDPRATLFRGSLKPYGMMQGLDSSFGAVVFIGYHGKAGSTGSFAAHTGSGRVADLQVNGVSVGEGGMNTLFAGWFGVPVTFISGDEVAVEQLHDLVPDAVGVAVKSGIWNQAVHTVSPDSARAAIRRGVARSVTLHPGMPRPQAPVRVELHYSSALYADIAEGIPSVRRIAPKVVGFTVDQYPAAYRMIRVLYKHLTP